MTLAIQFGRILSMASHEQEQQQRLAAAIGTAATTFGSDIHRPMDLFSHAGPKFLAILHRGEEEALEAEHESGEGYELDKIVVEGYSNPRTARYFLEAPMNSGLPSLEIFQGSGYMGSHVYMRMKTANFIPGYRGAWVDTQFIDHFSDNVSTQIAYTEGMVKAYDYLKQHGLRSLARTYLENVWDHSYEDIPGLDTLLAEVKDAKRWDAERMEEFSAYSRALEEKLERLKAGVEPINRRGIDGSPVIESAVAQSAPVVGNTIEASQGIAMNDETRARNVITHLVRRIDAQGGSFGIEGMGIRINSGELENFPNQHLWYDMTGEIHVMAQHDEYIRDIDVFIPDAETILARKGDLYHGMPENEQTVDFVPTAGIRFQQERSIRGAKTYRYFTMLLSDVTPGVIMIDDVTRELRYFPFM